MSDGLIINLEEIVKKNEELTVLTEKLVKKCPYCGNYPSITIENMQWHIFCPFYSCDNKNFYFAEHLNDAIEAWNGEDKPKETV